MDYSNEVSEQVGGMDESQHRMLKAVEDLLKVPEVYARLHEFDNVCEPELQQM
jgi:hypothetical protein